MEILEIRSLLLVQFKQNTAIIPGGLNKSIRIGNFIRGDQSNYCFNHSKNGMPSLKSKDRQ